MICSRRRSSQSCRTGRCELFAAPGIVDCIGSSLLSWISAMVIEKQRDQPLAALLICVIKARKKGAVEIEDAPDDAVLNQRDDEFGARIRIASNVAREIVDIRDQHRRGACRGGAADPLAYGDPHAGRFCLERTEHQLRAVAEIKSG